MCRTMYVGISNLSQKDSVLFYSLDGIATLEDKAEFVKNYLDQFDMLQFSHQAALLGLLRVYSNNTTNIL